MDTDITFLSDKREYSVSEFHDRFHSCLPKVVEVNQGVCSESGDETFAKGEVLVVTAISRQRRVVTECQVKQKPRLLSIPDTYSEKLCVVKKGIPGKEDLLVNILCNNVLPITVCFPRNKTISIGRKRLRTNDIPHLQLTEAFDEVSLIGHYINNGELYEEPVQVPLYLSQLRVSIVTGIKDQSVEKWKLYKRDLNRKCALIKYNRVFGSQDIAEYNPKAAHSGKALTYLEPMTYENIVNLVQTTEPQETFPDMTPEEIDELGLYEYLEVATCERQKQYTYYNQPQNRNRLKDNPTKVPKTTGQLSQPKGFVEQLQERHLALKPVTPTPNARPPIPPKPTLKPFNQKTLSPNPEKPNFMYSKQELSTSSAVESLTAPPLPDRPRSYYRSLKTNRQGKSESKYTNLLPTSCVAPTISSNNTSTRAATQNKIITERTERKYTTISQEVNSKDDVAKLSVEDVCGYLKLLNLSQYEKNFKEHMIDGALLQALEPELFIEDIGMKKIEVMRLMNFAKEGRLPVVS